MIVAKLQVSPDEVRKGLGKRRYALFRSLIVSTSGVILVYLAPSHQGSLVIVASHVSRDQNGLSRIACH